MRHECRERFPRHRGLAIPTYITTCTWRMCRDAVSFEVGDGEKFPGIPGACATHNFTYLARNPWIPLTVDQYSRDFFVFYPNKFLNDYSRIETLQCACDTTIILQQPTGWHHDTYEKTFPIPGLSVKEFISHRGIILTKDQQRRCSIFKRLPYWSDSRVAPKYFEGTLGPVSI